MSALTWAAIVVGGPVVVQIGSHMLRKWLAERKVG